MPTPPTYGLSLRPLWESDETIKEVIYEYMR